MMIEPYPELFHNVVLVRAAAARSKNAELKYLLNVFDHIPVSIYALPDFNIFDFALIGSLSDALVNTKIVEARRDDGRNRFDRIQAFCANRYVYHGHTLDHTDPALPGSLANVIGKKPWEANSKCFLGMLFIGANAKDEELRMLIRQNLHLALLRSGCKTNYCMSHLEPLSNISREPTKRFNRPDFSATPIAHCTCWVRFFIDIEQTVNPVEILNKVSHFHTLFKLQFEDDLTTVCFPVIPQKETSEFESRKDYCRGLLSRYQPQDVAPMLWFGFERDRSSGTKVPNIKLPLGNFVVSAKARVGKTSAALALAKAFTLWRANPREKPGDTANFSCFDVVYLNMKAIDGSREERTTVKATNEAHLLNAYFERDGITVECVRPKDLKFYLLRPGREQPAIIYTEPDGETAWAKLFSEISGVAMRGLLVIVDEAFNKELTGDKLADIRRFYDLANRSGETLGIRVVLIGPELGRIRDALADMRWILDSSTLIIGTQAADEHVRKMIVANCSAADVAKLDWLDCGTLQAINTIADSEERPNKLGPVIVRPSLFGHTICHPVPCHVRSIPLQDAERSALEWWRVEA
jgi:hypothetical protein